MPPTPARSGMLVKGRVEHSSLLTGKEGLVEPNHKSSSAWVADC